MEYPAVPIATLNTLEIRSEDLTVPLFVDLDGTLVRTDTLIENILSAIRSNLTTVVKIPRWLIRGRAWFKSKLAELHRIEIETLPFRESMCHWLRIQAASGRPVYLATASNTRIANAVAAHLGFFSGVIASDNRTNAKGKRKLDLIRTVAQGPFDYAGNGFEDIPIWRAARKAILVQTSDGVAKDAARQGNVYVRLEDSDHGWRPCLQALRPHQWLKNILLFVPLLTSLRFGMSEAWVNTILAFIAFSAVASATYIVNDLFDLNSDRAHPRKRWRPFASGKVMPQTGILMASLLLIGGFGLAATLPPLFVGILAAYLVVTIVYSLAFKSYVLVDALALAGLYTIRILGGAAAIGVIATFWLLAFAIFIFFSLALVKRCAELVTMQEQQKIGAKGRDYRVNDMSILCSIGTASGFSAVVVFALYITAHENAVRFATPELLWLICPALLYWIGRIWLKTARGEMNDDPLVFTVRDRGSRWVVVTIACLFAAAAAN